LNIPGFGLSLSSGTSDGKVVEGINRTIVEPDFVVAVGTSRATSAANCADLHSTVNSLARRCIDPRHMAISCRHAIAVIDHNYIAISSVVSGKDDNPIGRRFDGGAECG
jgi:hypothetical protein